MHGAEFCRFGDCLVLVAERILNYVARHLSKLLSEKIAVLFQQD